MSRGGKPAILILGASQMQLPAIRIGKELGWTVIAADANPDAPGVAIADYFEQVDLRNLEGMTAAARRHRDNHGLDGVFTVGTDFSATVAWVAGEIGLPGIPYEAALDASDKGRMRGVFVREGLPSPRFTSLTPGDNPVTVLEALNLPLVIKPADSMGARGVRKVDSTELLKEAVEDALEHSRAGIAIVEEYIDGPEFSLDALVYKDDIFLCGIADRHIFFPPFFVEMGHTMPSIFPQEDRQRVIDLFFSGIRALGITNGAAKGDIKLSDTGPVIGEIAARLSGGFMSGWTYPYSSGIRVIEAAMRIAVGLSPGPLKPVRNHTSAERAFISIPGVVKSIDRGQKDETAIRDIFFRTKPDQEVAFPTNNVQKCGNVIAADPDREKAIEQAEKVCREVFIRLKPFSHQTKEYIFGHSVKWAPDAFQLIDPGDLATYDTMPGVFSSLPAAAGSKNVAVLPALDKETSTDWHGESISTAFGRVLDMTGFEPVSVFSKPFAGPAVGKLFWKAFLRGGVQGGVWLLDSLSQIKSDEKRCGEVMSWLG